MYAMQKRTVETVKWYVEPNGETRYADKHDKCKLRRVTQVTETTIKGRADTTNGNRFVILTTVTAKSPEVLVAWIADMRGNGTISDDGLTFTRTTEI